MIARVRTHSCPAGLKMNLFVRVGKPVSRECAVSTPGISGVDEGFPCLPISLRGSFLTGKSCNNDLSSGIFYGSLMCKLKKRPVFDEYVKVNVLADVVVQIYIQPTYISSSFLPQSTPTICIVQHDSTATYKHTCMYTQLYTMVNP